MTVQLRQRMKRDRWHGVMLGMVGVVPVQPAKRRQGQNGARVSEHVRDEGTSAVFGHANDAHDRLSDHPWRQPIDHRGPALQGER